MRIEAPAPRVLARRAFGLARVDGEERLIVFKDGGGHAVKTVSADPVEAAILGGRFELGARVKPEQLLTPIKPSKIIGVGLNYHDHAGELGVPVPKLPQLFAKYPSALAAPAAVVVLASPETDYEVELGVVIGRRCRDVSVRDALGAVAGYVVVNDLSARDRQREDGQYVLAKSYDGYAPCGPALVPAEELGSASNLRLWTEVNGERLQDSTTANMAFGVRELVAYCSRNVTLEPGDLISTGTPPGVGFLRNPPRFLRDGDVVEVGIEGIGTLATRFTEESGGGVY